MKSKRITAFVSAMAVAASMLMPFSVVHAEATTLEVGTDKEYKTISAAVAKAKELNPQSEADRVTINVDPGDYEEQVMMEDIHYITLQQTPGTEGKVDLHWFYCTGYCAGNCGLDGRYDPKVNWSDPRTWTGYGVNENEEHFTAYELGQCLQCKNVSEKVTTISYYDTNGVAHKDVAVQKEHLGSFVDQAALFINDKSSNIIIKDFNIVNSIPVMVTPMEKQYGSAPEECRNADHATSYVLPRRDNLVICDEDTDYTTSTAIDAAFAIEDDASKVKALEALTNLTPEQSCYLVRSNKYNERGHAVATNGDMISFYNVRVRGNQDSLWVDGRCYFENCDLIGGTDYIYGPASAVFNNCLLGAEGMTNQSHGATITAANHDAKNPYGYLFWNCTLYNVLENITTSQYGRPWRQDAQITFYKTKFDNDAENLIGASPASINEKGWADMSDNQAALARFYEYGSYNANGTVVDTRKRVVNENGFGTVLDNWHIMEFNPYNTYNSEYWTEEKSKPAWDPMNFGAELTDVNTAMASATVTIPENEEVTFDLPTAPDGVTYKWESASTNAVVSDDGTKVTVIRPAAGEANIETTVALYVMDSETGYGDKKEIPVSITPTTNTTDVFDMPVTVTTSGSLDVDNDFTVTISKGGAVVKTDTVTMKANETTATKTIENIPANTEGIAYDVKVVSANSDITVTTPADGITTVTGIIGQNVPLNIAGEIQADFTVTTSAEYSSTEGNKTFDLIALAKAAGATDDIDTSEMIKVTYTLNVTPKSSDNSFIDILSGTPGASNNANGSQVPSRFVLAKLGHWDQLDMIDVGSGGYSGSSNTENQWLNAGGKFSNSPIQTIEVTIDYKNKLVKAKGANGEYTFAAFPTDYEKGKLNMAVYKGTETFSISDIKVTYKEVLADGETLPTPVPTKEPVVDALSQEKFNVDDITGGNLNNDGAVYKFVDGVDSELAAIFADSADSTKVDSYLVKGYKNYVGGTDGRASHPSIIASLPRNTYEIYYLGYNHGNTVTATIGDKTLTAGAGVDLCYLESNSSRVLKVYEMDLDLTSGAMKDATITFDSTDQWLPDFYAVVIKPTGVAQTPTPTTVPTSEPVVTTAPTEAPSTDTPSTAVPLPIPAIKSAKVEGGNTIVELVFINEGVVIALDRDGDTLKAVKTADVPAVDTVEKTVTIEGIEADEVYVWDSLEGMKPLCDSYTVTSTPTETTAPVETVDFTTMSAASAYTAEAGEGFVTESSAIMPEGYARKVAPASEITLSSEGAKITESTGSYLYEKSNKLDGDDYNRGGLIYRIDTGKPGAYRLEVEVTGSSSDTTVAPTGMTASRLTSGGTWDNPGLVAKKSIATWEGSKWTYDFATGEKFVEIEIEPKNVPSASAPQTVGVKSIKITPLEVNPGVTTQGDMTTIHILGDSTQKSYTFNETISAWGQTLKNYFSLYSINVVNYSMGGRAMKSNYNEGRFNDILVNGKEGDFVFIHSAHNDETTSTNRFSRGAGVASGNLAVNNENYNKWLDMYVEAIKARGMTPVLVTGMPRISNGRVNTSAEKPNGFNPDSPGNMRAKAAADKDVMLVELFDGAVDYINSIDAKEVNYIYNNIEAGETPADGAANGKKSDGTHYREAASKMWCKIMLQSIYDQSVAEVDTYTDKDIAKRLVAYMKDDVKEAAASGDWSKVFPEMASDVSAVGVVPGAVKQEESNYYYRNNIEKALEIGALKKDASNMFKPNDIITVGDFARGAEKAFGLEENSLTSYTKTYAELQAEASTPATVEALSDDVELFEDDAAGEGDITVTVTQPTGGTVTVYNESAFKTATSDVKGSEAASSAVADNDCFTLTAPENVVSGTDKTGVFADNAEISINFMEFRNDNKQFTYTAKADGVLTVYARTGDNKKVELIDIAGAIPDQSDYLNDGAGVGSGSNVYGTIKFNVTKGTSYYLHTRGGTGRLFGVKYESTNYPQSTTSLAVNSGDTVRVVAVPAENYVNGAILVDGVEKTTSKEYTFTASANATVTATFIAEPALVEVTKVPSDAALTREIMGAILYDAYLAKYGKDKNGEWNKVDYMNQNGGVPTPDDPNYDPNIKYEGSPYIPLTGWGALTDASGVDNNLYAKVKEAYNLGLIRSEQDIARGSISCGNQLEPDVKVTRAKAAKSLVFAYILTQPLKGENQLIPNNENLAANTVAEIAVPNADAPSAVVE